MPKHKNKSQKTYFNGNIITMALKQPKASAFSVMGDRFDRVGSDEEIKSGGGAETEMINLGGKTILPGIIESHNHLSIYATNLTKADCSSPLNRTISDVKKRIKKIANEIKPGQWILGYGYDDTLIENKRHIDWVDLDDVSPLNPVYIMHVSAHTAYANSLALKIAHIDVNTPQLEGGEILRDDKGRPTGALFEPVAMNLVGQHIPGHSTTQIKTLIENAVTHFNRFGITSIHDGGIGYTGNAQQIIQAYRELEKEGKLNIRVYMTIIEEVYRKLIECGFATGFGSNRLKLGSVKFWLDGSIQISTAALSTPYKHKPDLRGDLLIPEERLKQLIEKYHRAGCQVAIHANGDRAIESALQAFEAANAEKDMQNGRHMIIHCQLSTVDQIKRMKKMGIIPNYFVNHVYYWGDRHQSIFLGYERARRINPLNTTLKNGVRFCLHSDLPVTPVDPIFSLHAAVNRMTREGHLLGSEERIPAVNALKAYTIDAAYCSFEEKKKGSIEPGKLADFIVLSDNPLEVPPENIKNIKVLQTFIGGEMVYNGI